MTNKKTLKMKRLFLALFAMLVAGLTWAGPEDDALAAYLRKDYAAVLKIVKPPALKGEAWAQGWLADAYTNGQGVVQDQAEAVKWYRLAAEQGRAIAQYNLGNMYRNGKGVVQDYAQAVKWYRLAAEQGDADGQYNLGLMHYNGTGVVQDYVKAHIWFNLSAVNGDADAVKGRDVVAKRMTPQQIVDAQKLARDCQARQLKGCE